MLATSPFRFHPQEHREESGCPLASQPPPKSPRATRIHVPGTNVWDENLKWTPQRNGEAFGIPRRIRHGQRLEECLCYAGECSGYQIVGLVHRDWGVIVVEGGLQPQGCDGGCEAPAQVSQALEEMWSQPKVIGAYLPIVLALAQSSFGNWLSVGVDHL